MSLQIKLLTIFPDLVRPFFVTSLLGRATSSGLVDLEAVDLREFGHGRHRQVDDAVFGGGPGMVFKADVVAAAVDATAGDPEWRRLYMSPSGRRLDQELLHDLARQRRLCILCGRYEGVDERVLQARAFEAVSIGDYVVAGGEVAALVVVEGVCRLLPGVMGNAASAVTESFEDGLLEAPCYTRPAVWEGRAVPEVLLSGDHRAVAAWRRTEALRRTAQRRPDLLSRAVAAGKVSQDELDALDLD
jgi:tRNA (guanine37-N1)-methyltransferase